MPTYRSSFVSVVRRFPACLCLCLCLFSLVCLSVWSNFSFFLPSSLRWLNSSQPETFCFISNFPFLPALPLVSKPDRKLLPRISPCVGGRDIMPLLCRSPEVGVILSSIEERKRDTASPTLVLGITCCLSYAAWLESESECREGIGISVSISPR